VTLHGSKCARSPVPMSRAHRQHTRIFAALPRRMPLTSDSLAERNGFELSVPISKLADDNFKRHLQRSDQ
jgi:hypothetical protein